MKVEGQFILTHLEYSSVIFNEEQHYSLSIQTTYFLLQKGF